MKMIMKQIVVAALVLFVAASAVNAATLKVDPKLKSYTKVSGVSGNLNSVGSDTLNNLMTMWAESFRKIYPNVNIQIEGKGSSTAPPALIEGVSQLGPMSRKMKNKEAEAFEAKFGFKPTTLGVALDSLAVYVNKDNPVNEMSLQQVDAMFSKTRKCGYPKAFTRWGDIGLKGSYASRPVSLYGRNSASGTYGYFKKHALCKGDYSDSVKEQPGSASVVQGVGEDKGGLGYSGIGYKTSDVKVVALSKKDGQKAYEPTYENVLSGNYPLGRLLYVNVVKQPNKPLDKLQKEFLKFVLSKEGQEIVIKDGYLPLTAEVAAKMAKMLD